MEQKVMRYAAPNPDLIQDANDEPAAISEPNDFRFIDGDAALVSSLRAGHRGAFEVLVKRHQGRLFKTALNITNNREDAEDVVQDAFLNAFKHFDNFRGDSRFATWLTRITINQALMALRAKPRKTTSLDESRETEKGKTAYEIPASGYTPEQLCSQREFERLLFTGTAGMSERLRQVWCLHTVQDLSDREIAHVLGVTLAATKTRLSRARRELRKRLDIYIPGASASTTVRIASSCRCGRDCAG
jgi:RNA polymerase sigma-70 factor (ECF subfamily)